MICTEPLGQIFITRTIKETLNKLSVLRMPLLKTMSKSIVNFAMNIHNHSVLLLFVQLLLFPKFEYVQLHLNFEHFKLKLSTTYTTIGPICARTSACFHRKKSERYI